MRFPFQECSLWVVVIGIDDYKSGQQLQYADAISEHFINQLSVPPGNMWSLHQDPRIQYGDTIVILYAGHGSAHNTRRLCFKKSERNRINVED
jgi:hypothetical protein